MWIRLNNKPDVIINLDNVAFIFNTGSYIQFCLEDGKSVDVKIDNTMVRDSVCSNIRNLVGAEDV